MAEEVCYGLAQEYLFNVGLKMGTLEIPYYHRH
ncbi:hypothetical protein LTSEINV_6231, partial [Salmonella enterica subsp. enterica serovar Inverness str. R8-3668]